MTTEDLKKYARELDDMIYGEQACYGLSDMRRLSEVMQELESRGVKATTILSFNE